MKPCELLKKSEPAFKNLTGIEVLNLINSITNWFLVGAPANANG